MEHHQATASDTPPPPFHLWKRLYTIVLSFLGILILLFYLFAQAYK